LLALLGTSQASCEWLSSRHAARVANPNRLQAKGLRKSCVTGQPPIRLHFARCHLQNARFEYEKEQTLRTLQQRLSSRELAAVLNDLKRKAPRSKNTRMNLALFRLACCCGLRASGIANLQVSDVRTELARPHIRIRDGAAKGGRSRVVPLWWDAGTLEDLAARKTERLRQGAGADQPFLAFLIPGRVVKPFSRHTLRKRFGDFCVDGVRLSRGSICFANLASFNSCGSLPRTARRSSPTSCEQQLRVACGWREGGRF
jgi:integrase